MSAFRPVYRIVIGLVAVVGGGAGQLVLRGTKSSILLVFFGLAVVMPVLAHATWHLYRKVVAT